MVSGLVGIARLLRLERDAAILVALDSDSLVIYESSVLFRVLVAEVKGIPRELNASGAFGFDEVGILVS